MCLYSLLYIVISLILDTLIKPCIIHQCMYSLCISLVVLHNAVVHGVMCLAQPHTPRPSDERPPVMYGHFWLVPRVSVHRRYYCTVEPLSNDHPHQWPSLLYDHILSDGQCFLFVRSLTDDHPSDVTNDRVRWDFLPRERPPRLQSISKNRGWRFNICSQWRIITMLCLDTFQVIQLLWTLFYFGDDATTTFSDRRCIITMLPARRRSDTFVIGLIQLLWTSRI